MEHVLGPLLGFLSFRVNGRHGSRGLAPTHHPAIPNQVPDVPVVAPAATAASDSLLFATLDRLRVGVMAVDVDDRILFANHAARGLLADGGQEIVGRSLYDLTIGEDALKAVRRHPKGSPTATRAATHVRRGGTRYSAEIEIHTDPGDARQRLVYFYDIAEACDVRPEAPGGRASALDALVGESTLLQLVRRQIATVAGVDATVLIEGETGTGKEVVARGIHASSRRKDRPFIAVNCAGLTESLLSSQLFGHRRGAFTGAVSDHVGLFEAAQFGTLLLDEIGDMPMGVQTHLLRVLQEREILRLGDSMPRPIDVRILAATHRNLEQAVLTGQFRQDLLYRIRVARIALPPLRHRAEDVPRLAAAFARQAPGAQDTIRGITPEAMEYLTSLRWPGNVRELKSAIEWAVIRVLERGGTVIGSGDLPAEVSSDEILSPRVHRQTSDPEVLVDALTRAGGNRSVAARLLGISRATLYRRLAELADARQADVTRPSTPPAGPEDSCFV